MKKNYLKILDKRGECDVYFNRGDLEELSTCIHCGAKKDLIEAEKNYSIRTFCICDHCGNMLQEFAFTFPESLEEPATYISLAYSVELLIDRENNR